MSSIITSAYIAAKQYPLNHARIGYRSWAASMTAAAITVSSEVAGYPKDGPLRPDTYEGWRPSGAGTWTIDLGAARAVDYAGLIGDFQGVSILLQYASSAGGPWTTFAGAITPANAAPVMLFDASVSARYWRITLGAQATVYSVYLGQELVMPRPFFDGHTPIALARQIEVRSSQSRGGQYLGQDIIRYGVQASVRWQNIEQAWYRANFDALVLHLRNKPVFFAWNLSYPEELAYLWTADPIQPVNVAQTSGGLFSISASFRGVGYRE